SVLAFISRSLFPDIEPGMALIALTSVLPVAIGGILIAALTAFIVTTGNSYLLSAATSVIYDFFGKYMKKDITDHQDRKSTRLNSSHVSISYAVFCLKKKNDTNILVTYN